MESNAFDDITGHFPAAGDLTKWGFTDYLVTHTLPEKAKPVPVEPKFRTFGTPVSKAFEEEGPF